MPLGLIAAVSATDAAIQKKDSRSVTRPGMSVCVAKVSDRLHALDLAKQIRIKSQE